MVVTLNYLRCWTVRQGWPLSPILLNLVMETLAVGLCRDRDITGLKIANIEYKFLLYADDIVLFLTNSLSSLSKFQTLLSQYCRFTGYKVKYGKSCLMEMNIPRLLKDSIRKISEAQWVEDTIHYLNI